MKFTVEKSDTFGEISIPGSKSHTIRAVYFASLAEGESIIKEPLLSGDTKSAIHVCQSLGADIKVEDNKITVNGFGKTPKTPGKVIDVGNSGTTLRIGLATAALCDGDITFTGDEQIQSRPLDPLIDTLNDLGAHVSTEKDNGKAPVTVSGKAKGGKTDLEAKTSQYLTALLINAPLFENPTEINLTLLNEIPYVDITLEWLNKLNIQYENQDYKKFIIPGNQTYKPVNVTIPGDFSSASFFFGLGALSANGITLNNLNMNDPQGDKRVIDILKQMGADISIENASIHIKKNKLKGMDIDMNDIPDALPIMAVIGCFAEGETKLLNCPQAREKETDRIAKMNEELSKMGAEIEELKDGLIIKQSKLTGSSLSGHEDHRIVMALTIAGLKSEGMTTIDTAEAVEVTFPNFINLIKSCNGNIKY